MTTGSSARKTSKTAGPTTVRVELGTRGYDILIGRGLLASVGARIAALRPGAAAAVIVDRNVNAIHGDAVIQSLSAAGLRSARIVIEPGEASKRFQVLEAVTDALLTARMERGDLVLALGGGVIGDLSGFAASIIRRGMDFVQLPTSLLAQVDSSVGGKTGINSHHGKNLIGAFHQPVLVLADTAALDTLPQREFLAGYAEVVKYGLIDKPEFFDWLEENWGGVCAGTHEREHAIAVSCRAKAEIVARDEKETGDRALLNLGHTFGHALEAGAGYSGRLLHGEGVAIGICLAFEYSATKGLCPPGDVERVRAHLKAVGLPTRIADVEGDLPDTDGLMTLIAQDKKVSRGTLTFILAHGIGKSFVARDVPADDIRAFLTQARS